MTDDRKFNSKKGKKTAQSKKSRAPVFVLLRSLGKKKSRLSLPCCLSVPLLRLFRESSMAPEFTNDDGFITWVPAFKEVIYRVPRALRWFVLTAGIAAAFLSGGRARALLGEVFLYGSVLGVGVLALWKLETIHAARDEAARESRRPPASGA